MKRIGLNYPLKLCKEIYLCAREERDFHRNARDDAKRRNRGWCSSGFAVQTRLRVKDILFTAMVAMTQREGIAAGVLRGLQCKQG
jgi:hypothetical protein